VNGATYSFLDDVVARRRSEIAVRYGALSAADRERLACCARAPRDFAAALLNTGALAVIAEVKKASPSAGPIAIDADVSKIALHYQDGGAACISVLTEPTAFCGSFTDLSDVADAVDVPVLCKDFVVDEVQPYVARGHGADALLLMVSVLGEGLGNYLDLCTTLGLQALVEVVSLDELETARRAGASLVCVNTRDLGSLAMDAESALPVIAAAKSYGMTAVLASGVKTRADVERAAAAGADAVLVGEALMRAEYPEDVLQDLTGVGKRP
jgi:indole-3-glycerol phosphate synthase